MATAEEEVKKKQKAPPTRSFAAQLAKVSVRTDDEAESWTERKEEELKKLIKEDSIREDEKEERSTGVDRSNSMNPFIVNGAEGGLKDREYATNLQEEIRRQTIKEESPVKNLVPVDQVGIDGEFPKKSESIGGKENEAEKQAAIAALEERLEQARREWSEEIGKREDPLEAALEYKKEKWEQERGPKGFTNDDGSRGITFGMRTNGDAKKKDENLPNGDGERKIEAKENFNANSWEELFTAIETTGEVKGTTDDVVYTPKKLKERIQDIRWGELREDVPGLTAITRSRELRDVVERLLGGDKKFLEDARWRLKSAADEIKVKIEAKETTKDELQKIFYQKIETDIPEEKADDLLLFEKLKTDRFHIVADLKQKCRNEIDKRKVAKRNKDAQENDNSEYSKNKGDQAMGEVSSDQIVQGGEGVKKEEYESWPQEMRVKMADEEAEKRWDDAARQMSAEMDGALAAWVKKGRKEGTDEHRAYEAARDKYYQFVYEHESADKSETEQKELAGTFLYARRVAEAVRIAREESGQKAKSIRGKIGEAIGKQLEWYRNLPAKKKVIIGAAMGVAAIGMAPTSIVGASALGAAGFSLRLLGLGSMAKGFKEGLDKRAEGRYRKDDRRSEYLSFVEMNAQELNDALKRMDEQLMNELSTKKKENIKRYVAAIGGAGAIAAATFLLGRYAFETLGEKVQASLAGAGSPEIAPTDVPGVSADAMHIPKGDVPTEVQSVSSATVESPLPPPADTVPSPTIEDAVSIPESHQVITVEKGDSIERSLIEHFREGGVSKEDAGRQAHLAWLEFVKAHPDDPFFSSDAITTFPDAEISLSSAGNIVDIHDAKGAVSITFIRDALDNPRAGATQWAEIKNMRLADMSSSVRDRFEELAQKVAKFTGRDISVRGGETTKEVIARMMGAYVEHKGW